MTQEQALFLKKAFDTGYKIFISRDDELIRIEGITYNIYILNEEKLMFTAWSWKGDCYVDDFLINVDYDHIAIFEEKNKAELQQEIGGYTVDFLEKQMKEKHNAMYREEDKIE